MTCPKPGHEEASLLRAIREGDPCDDVLRQVYADFLTDQGRVAHAHLVRHQKDHHDPFVASPEPAPDAPAAREAAAFACEALREWVGLTPHEVNVQFRRGLLHVVMPVGLYLSGAYGDGLRACRRAGWVETIELIDLTDRDVIRLPYATTRPAERLAMRANSLTAEGTRALDRVARLESVEVAAWDVGRVPRLPELRRMVWYVGGRLPGLLGPLEGHARLRHLRLEGIGPVEEAALGPAFTLLGLRHLELDYVGGLTDETLRRLEALKELRTLSVRGDCSFSEEGLARLRRALPRCEARLTPAEVTAFPF